MKYLRISEEDLAVLESELPRLLDGNPGACDDPVVRKRWEAVKRILSDVRWNYGPPVEERRIDPVGPLDEEVPS